jgi:hypothetical protein
MNPGEKSRGLTFIVDDREYAMSEALIVRFLVRVRCYGMPGDKLFGCDDCRTVCFDPAWCECERHSMRRGDLGEHRPVAKIQDVLQMLKRDRE